MPARAGEGKPIRIHPSARRGRKRRLGKVRDAFIRKFLSQFRSGLGSPYHEDEATVKANLYRDVRALAA
jgi:hypothetical protein